MELSVPGRAVCRSTVGDANDTREGVEQDDAPSLVPAHLRPEDGVRPTLILIPPAEPKSVTLPARGSVPGALRPGLCATRTCGPRHHPRPYGWNTRMFALRRSLATGPPRALSMREGPVHVGARIAIEREPSRPCRSETSSATTAERVCQPKEPSAPLVAKSATEPPRGLPRHDGEHVARARRPAPGEKRVLHRAAQTLAFSAGLAPPINEERSSGLIAARASCGDTARFTRSAPPRSGTRFPERPDEAPPAAPRTSPEPSVKHRPSWPDISPNSCPQPLPGCTPCRPQKTKRGQKAHGIWLLVSAPERIRTLTFGSVVPVKSRVVV